MKEKIWARYYLTCFLFSQWAGHRRENIAWKKSKRDRGQYNSSVFTALSYTVVRVDKKLIIWLLLTFSVPLFAIKPAVNISLSTQGCYTKIWPWLIVMLLVIINIPHFIKGRAPGKLTCCEDYFTQLVWPCRGNFLCSSQGSVQNLLPGCETQ